MAVTMRGVVTIATRATMIVVVIIMVTRVVVRAGMTIAVIAAAHIA